MWQNAQSVSARDANNVRPAFSNNSNRAHLSARTSQLAKAVPPLDKTANSVPNSVLRAKVSVPRANVNNARAV